jgi:hypothetical protein
VAICKAVEPLFDLIYPHCIVAKSLRNFVDCFHLGIPKFLSKLDAVSLLQVFCHLEQNKMRQTHVTPLHYLAVTDTSGGVVRQQKIMHAHQSPLYHYIQFLHPFAITCHGKKYSWILFRQTM